MGEQGTDRQRVPRGFRRPWRLSVVQTARPRVSDLPPTTLPPQLCRCPNRLRALGSHARRMAPSAAAWSFSVQVVKRGVRCPLCLASAGPPTSGSGQFAGGCWRKRRPREEPLPPPRWEQRQQRGVTRLDSRGGGAGRLPKGAPDRRTSGEQGKRFAGLPLQEVTRAPFSRPFLWSSARMFPWEPDQRVFNHPKASGTKERRLRLNIGGRGL